MTTLAIFFLMTLASLLILWPCFWALFALWPEMTEGKTPKSIPYYIIGVIGVIADIWVNITIGTVLFLQLPHYKRLLLSARMDDLIVNGSGWQFKLALWIVAVLLEPYDKTGQHTTHGKK